MGVAYHGAEHAGHVDGISPSRAVFARVPQIFRIHIQDPQTDVQDSTFKLVQKDTVDFSNLVSFQRFDCSGLIWAVSTRKRS